MSASTAEAPAPPSRGTVLSGGLWSAASQVIPALGTAVLSVAAGRVLGSGPLGQQSLIAYLNSALTSVFVISLNTALLQAGGRLQGQRDPVRLKALMRWSIGAHLAAGAVVLVAMVALGEITAENRIAWAIVGAVAVLDAATDGLAIRLILVEGWGPIGRLRLIFQMIGPFVGVGFLFAGLGIPGIFLGDGVAALGLLFAALPRFRRLRDTIPLSAPQPAPDQTTPDQAAPRRAAPSPASPQRPRPSHPAVSTLVADTALPGLQSEQLRRPRPGPGRRESPEARHKAEASRSWWQAPTPVARIVLLFAVGALITQVVSKRVEFIVLAGFSGDVAVGMYSVAFMAVSLLSMVPLGIATAAMPLVAAAEGRGDIAPAARHLHMALRVGTAVTIPMVGLLAAAGPAAVTLVYGPSYRTASLLVPFASSALLVSVIAGVCTQFWSGRGRLRIVLLSGTAAGVVDVGVALALVPAYAATGATAANVAGQIVLAGGLLYATVRELGPTGWRLRSLLASVGTAGAAAAAVLLVGLVIDVLAPFGIEARSVLIVVLGGAAGVVTAIGAAMVTKILGPDEHDWVAGMLPARFGALLARMSRPERAASPAAGPAT